MFEGEIMNYKIEGINVLLNKECILERYYPLIPFKDEIVNLLKKNGINTKEEALNCDAILNNLFNDDKLTFLFKRFLNMYEINKSKLKEIDKLNLSEEERKSFQELYLLPGVKETRARLYYLSGLRTLNVIANKTTKEIIELTLKTINEMNLQYKAPLEKEVNTHIAVAKLIKIYNI